jgi:hypothetical protein
MNYVLIEESTGAGLIKVSGPGTIEQLEALLPDDLTECEADYADHRSWSNEFYTITYTIVPLTPI